jgi:DNA topoisomerase-3
MVPKKGKHNDHSHQPIHPTKDSTGAQFSPEERSLYELVTRHFLACCSKDALGKETTVTIQIAGEFFSAKGFKRMGTHQHYYDKFFLWSGLVVEESNWLDVYPYEKWTDQYLPKFNIDEQFVPTSLMMEEGNFIYINCE